MTAKRQVWAAVLLSLLTPGLGHLYGGRARAALTIGLLASPLAASLLLLDMLVAPTPAAFAVLGVAIVLTFAVGIPVNAALLARRAGAAYQLQSFNRPVVYVAFVALVGIVWQQGAFRLWKAYVAEAFRNPSVAGEPTLLVGDYFYVVKFPASARRPGLDSLIVFPSLEEPALRVFKRAVGLPGDTLSMRDGVLYRNGRQVSEPYARRHDSPSYTNDRFVSKMRAWQVPHLIGADPARYLPTTRDWGPLVVPPDSFFAMGDNRDESYDSRFYGFIPLASASGRPRRIYFSREPGSGVRWKRIGLKVF